jgi:hypothetical protein
MTELRLKRKVNLQKALCEPIGQAISVASAAMHGTRAPFFFCVSVLTRQVSAAEYGCELGRTGAGIVAALDAAHHISG